MEKEVKSKEGRRGLRFNEWLVDINLRIISIEFGLMLTHVECTMWVLCFYHILVLYIHNDGF